MPFWDALIIGSGITGLTSAIFLKRNYPKSNIGIVEKGALPSGASTRNAGFACFGSMSEILDDLKNMKEEEVFDLISRRYEGLIKLRELLGDEKIGYKPTGGFEIFRSQAEHSYRECIDFMDDLNKNLVQAIGNQAFKDISSQISSFGFRGVNHMILNSLEGTIDTGLAMKNLIGLARETGVEIINGCEVNELADIGECCALDTNIGEILARRVVIATNGFVRKLLPEAKVEPCRGQVLITNKLRSIKWHGCFHHDRGYDYFRDIDGRILLGGGRHLDKTGETTTEQGVTDAIQAHLENLLREVIIPETEFRIEGRWSGIMGIGNSKSVILRKTQDKVYCAVRLGGMGVALGTSLGQAVSELVDLSA